MSSEDPVSFNNVLLKAEKEKELRFLWRLILNKKPKPSDFLVPIIIYKKEYATKYWSCSFDRIKILTNDVY